MIAKKLFLLLFVYLISFTYSNKIISQLNTQQTCRRQTVNRTPDNLKVFDKNDYADRDGCTRDNNTNCCNWCLQVNKNMNRSLFSYQCNYYANNYRSTCECWSWRYD
jgi:hypothetical protein